MATRAEILDFCWQLLDCESWSDYGPNGMQVAGAESVTHVSSAVSSSLEVFERAGQAGSQLLLVHHGLFWRNTPQVIDTPARKRLQTLFEHDLTLAAYHLPLDAHPTLGNNAILARELNLTTTDQPFAIFEGKPVGVIAEDLAGRSLDTLLDDVARVTDRQPLHLGARPDSVRRIAICSGGAASEVAAAAAAGADVLITGEAAEPTMAAATEAGIAFIAAGHYATEVFGIRALGEAVAEQFGIEHVFLPAANPV